jgi:hypothetical protein
VDTFAEPHPFRASREIHEEVQWIHALVVGLHWGPAAPFTGGDQGNLDSHHSPAAQLSGRLSTFTDI